MKKILFINICILLIIALTAGTYYMSKPGKHVAAKLIKQRIEILSDFYYGNALKKDTYMKLCQIETPYFLEKDVKLIDMYSNSDLDRVLDYEITIKDIKENKYGFITGQANIVWINSNNTSRYTEEILYEFVLEKAEKKYMLNELKKIQ